MNTLPVARINLWASDYRIAARELFGVVPDPWQDDVLEAFPHNQRMALMASKGVGKTCVLAWCAWIFLLTHKGAQIYAVSQSADQLRDALWKEMAYWRSKSPLLQEAFTWQKEQIFYNDSSKANLSAHWWMRARSYPKAADANTLGTTLAGLHAEYVMVVLDESGGMPEALLPLSEAVLAGCKEGHIIQAGNPTHREGPLYRACSTSERQLWWIKEINGDPDNPLRSPRVPIQWARAQIEQYGRDNPWVLVNVFGRFPPSSFNALVGVDELEDSVKRRYRENDLQLHPRILGIDVARYGDDSSIIFPRQGLVAFNPLQFRNVNSIDGANLAIRKWNDWDADACFVDNTGGFGAGWIDNMHVLGKSPIPVHFSQPSGDPQYFNKRAEMAFKLVEWIKRGGQIPDIFELKKALSSTTYTFKGSQLILEPKEDIKEKLQFSPDHMDALMLTFAMPVESDRTSGKPPSNSVNTIQDYNPFDRSRLFS